MRHIALFSLSCQNPHGSVICLKSEHTSAGACRMSSAGQPPWAITLGSAGLVSEARAAQVKLRTQRTPMTRWPLLVPKPPLNSLKTSLLCETHLIALPSAKPDTRFLSCPPVLHPQRSHCPQGSRYLLVSLSLLLNSFQTQAPKLDLSPQLRSHIPNCLMGTSTEQASAPETQWSRPSLSPPTHTSFPAGRPGVPSHQHH